MEAIYLDCGPRGPQLKRNPLGGDEYMIRNITRICCSTLVVASTSSCKAQPPEQHQASSTAGPCEAPAMAVVQAAIKAALAGAYHSRHIEDSSGVDTLVLVQDELRSDMAPIVSGVQATCLAPKHDTIRVELAWQVLGRLSVGGPFEPEVATIVDTAVAVRAFGQWKLTTDAVLQAFISPRTAATVGKSWGVSPASLAVLDSLATRYSP